MVYRGHVKSGVVVFEDEVQLPEGAEVSVEIIPATAWQTVADQLGVLIGSVHDLPSGKTSSNT